MKTSLPLRAFVLPVTLIVLAVVGLGGAGLAGWRPLDAFRRKPDTAALAAAQTQLAAAQQAEAAARAAAQQAQVDKDSALAAERAKFEAQLRSAQQSNVGAEYILGKVADPSPEVALGRSMVARTNLRFAAALGALPKDQQDDIVQMMDGILAQRDDALKKLADTDRKFTALTGEHAATQQTLAATAAQLTTVNAQVATLSAETGKIQGIVTVKTNEIAVIAKNLSDARSTSSSLGAAAQRWFYVVLALAGLWAFLAFVLPSIVKVMRPGALKTSLRNLSGYVLNPVLHHDAATKIAALARELTAPPSPSVPSVPSAP